MTARGTPESPTVSSGAVTISPYKTQSRSMWTLSANARINSNPSANSEVKTTPSAALLSTFPNFCNDSVNQADRTPTTMAPRHIATCRTDNSVAGLMTLASTSQCDTKNAPTTPNSDVWLIASPIKLCFRSNRKQPGSAHAIAANAPITTTQVSSSVQVSSGVRKVLMVLSAFF